MPRYTFTHNQEITVPVEANDILQVKSGSVEVKNSIHASDPATFIFRGHLSAITFNEPKTIIIRSQSRSSVVDLIKGL